MRKTLLASAALLGMALSLPAFAQDNTAAPPGSNAPNGTMQNGTMQNGAAGGQGMEQNTPADEGTATPRNERRAVLAPLPQSNVAANAAPTQFLQAAQQAVQRHRGGVAESALSEAETRLLNRAVAPSEASMPDRSPAIQDIEQAREAVSRRDWQGADQHIAAAMQHAQMAQNGMNGGNAMPAQQTAMPVPPASGMVQTPPAVAAPQAGGMTQGTTSVPMGGVMPPNGGVMQPNGGVMPPSQ
jgi:hypothetical protein